MDNESIEFDAIVDSRPRPTSTPYFVRHTKVNGYSKDVDAPTRGIALALVAGFERSPHPGERMEAWQRGADEPIAVAVGARFAPIAKVREPLRLVRDNDVIEIDPEWLESRRIANA